MCCTSTGPPSSIDRMGYAEALAWTLFAVLILFTGAAVLSTRRRVHYDFEERGL